MKRILISIVLLLLMSGCTQNTTTKYVVNFESNNETVMESVLVDSWDSILEHSIPIKEGHTFVGWYSDAALKHVYDLVNPVTSNLTLYAKWEVNQYNVTFLDEDGSIFLVTKKDYGFDFTTGVEDTPVKEGYTFSGWDELPNLMPAYDITVTAIFAITSYTVQYIKFDGTLIYSEEFEYLEEIVDFDIPQNTCEVGLEFFGWDVALPNTMPKHNIIVTEMCLFSSAQFILDEDITTRLYGAPQISGNYLIIYGSSSNNDQGALFVYKSNDPAYKRIIPSHYYGKGMISQVKGDYIFITYGPYIDPGEIYVLKLSDPDYLDVIFEGDIDYPAPADDIQIEGDIMIIHSYYGEPFNAAIFIYKISDSSYERMIYNYYPEDECEMCPWYTGILGLPVYVQGDYIIISSGRYNSYNDPNLFIYKLSDPLYERRIPEDDTTTQYYHIEGDYIITSDSGIVYVYKLSDSLYQRKITRSDLEPSDRFASEVFVVGDFVVIMDSDYNDGEGAVYLYRLSNPSYEKIISIGCENIWADENYVYLYNGEELQAILLSAIEETD